MALKDFLAAKPNLHAREELFNYRLLYDLKHAAFVRGYHLQAYYSDVDHDGFDIIFDDHDVVRKIQLKTVANDAGTASCGIHRQIIRPTPNHLEGFGLASDAPSGVEGGVILIEYEVGKDGETIGLKYYYTELSLIVAIRLGLLPRPAQTVEAAKGVLNAISTGMSTEKVDVAGGLFVQAANPHHLLCLLGLNAIIHRNWQYRIFAIAREEWGQKGAVSPDALREYREEIFDLMKEVCGVEKP